MNHAHNVAHVYVGGMFMKDKTLIWGSMASVDTSPNDPVFFLHHANVDRLWALWEERHGNTYLADGQGYSGWSRQSEMHPFREHLGNAWVSQHGVTPGDMLDMRELGYEYH
jgi:tyrosinase